MDNDFDERRLANEKIGQKVINCNYYVCNWMVLVG